jgi:MinD-like ATPase involved in chromosome partitioning or flagellar assembly
VEPVHFTDGFDRPDTIALGLDAPRLITVVVGALLAYAVMQSPLPMALRVFVAVLLGLSSALLGWARYAGRPLLTWTWLALRFVLSPQSGGAAAATAPAVAEEPAAAPEPGVVAEEPVAARVEDDVPVWARWLDFEAEPSAPPVVDAAPGDVVETAREAPLVVVMDEPSAERTAVANDGGATASPAASAAWSTGTALLETSSARQSKTDIDTSAPPATAAAPQDTGAPDDTPAAFEPAPMLTLVADAPSMAPEHAAVLQFPVAHRTVDRAPMAQPLAPDTAPPPVFVGAPRRITFFSLNGGSGRTTLATEVACVLAARGRHLASDGTVRPLDVALLDLDLRSATIAVRLGIPQPTLADYVTRGADPAHLDACMVRHASGVRALLGMPKPIASGPGALEPARVAEIVHHLERDGAQFVVLDVAADLGAVTTWVLSAVHDIFVVITPTATGVQDAYRTTAALRRLGLGHKLRYVVNRARGSVALDEVMGDLGGRIAAVIPYDPTVEDAENNHRIAALDGDGSASAALHDLAALLYPSISSAHRRTRLSWLPWRRHAG